jgi:hypothetical protein
VGVFGKKFGEMFKNLGEQIPEFLLKHVFGVKNVKGLEKAKMWKILGSKVLDKTKSVFIWVGKNLKIGVEFFGSLISKATNWLVSQDWTRIFTNVLDWMAKGINNLWRFIWGDESKKEVDNQIGMMTAGMGIKLGGGLGKVFSALWEVAKGAVSALWNKIAIFWKNETTSFGDKIKTAGKVIGTSLLGAFIFSKKIRGLIFGGIRGIFSGILGIFGKKTSLVCAQASKMANCMNMGISGGVPSGVPIGRPQRGIEAPKVPRQKILLPKAPISVYPTKDLSNFGKAAAATSVSVGKLGKGIRTLGKGALKFGKGGAAGIAIMGATSLLSPFAEKLGISEGAVSTFSNVLAGAATGMMLGPWGALVGGVGGLIWNLGKKFINTRKEIKKFNEEIKDSLKLTKDEILKKAPQASISWMKTTTKEGKKAIKYIVEVPKETSKGLAYTRKIAIVEGEKYDKKVEERLRMEAAGYTFVASTAKKSLNRITKEGKKASKAAVGGSWGTDIIDGINNISKAYDNMAWKSNEVFTQITKQGKKASEGAFAHSWGLDFIKGFDEIANAAKLAEGETVDFAITGADVAATKIKSAARDMAAIMPINKIPIIKEVGGNGRKEIFIGGMQEVIDILKGGFGNVVSELKLQRGAINDKKLNVGLKPERGLVLGENAILATYN